MRQPNVHQSDAKECVRSFNISGERYSGVPEIDSQVLFSLDRPKSVNFMYPLVSNKMF